MCTSAPNISKHKYLFFTVYLGLALANQIQFYNPTTSFGLALSSAVLDNGTAILLQLTAPASYGWAALGTGSMMDASLMFIIYPSSSDDDNNDLTLSLRTAKQNNAPHPLTSNTTTLTATLTSSTIKAGKMTANIAAHLPFVLNSRLDATYHAQPFIWAVGPLNSSISSSDPSHPLSKHSTNGVFFADMPQAQNPQEGLSAPSLISTTNTGVRTQPKAYHILVLLHAILLAGSFILVFPAGVITLRNVPRLGVKLHIALQVFGAVAVVAGAGVAITMSILGIQYAHLRHPHQIVGLSVAGLVGLQLYLGHAHHVRYTLFKRRTWFSFAHMGVGRVVIYGGIANAVLGLWLCKRILGMIGVAVAGGVVGFVMEFVAVRACVRRGRKEGRNEQADSDVAAYHKLKDVTVAEREVRAEYEVNYGRVGDQGRVSGGRRFEGFRHVRA